MKVYICGKIGEEVLSSETREKFARAEKMLRSKGYDVFNPTTSGFGESAELAAVRYGTSFYKEIIIYDLAALKQCDAIYMLSDWEKSPGMTTLWQQESRDYGRTRRMPLSSGMTKKRYRRYGYR